MGQWYVLSTVSGREQETAKFLERAISRDLCDICCIPRKMKVFRSGGCLHLMEDVMFPGYIFVKTKLPGELSKELLKAKKFPQFIRGDGMELVPVESQDLDFLQDVCGKNLQQTMGVTKLSLGMGNEILEAKGILKNYLKKIVKLNLHKRFAVVEIELFNRKQEVLFGLQLEQDRAG